MFVFSARMQKTSAVQFTLVFSGNEESAKHLVE